MCQASFRSVSQPLIRQAGSTPTRLRSAYNDKTSLRLDILFFPCYTSFVHTKLRESEVLRRRGNCMTLWQELNERQQQYLKTVYEVDQEQEKDERSVWSRGEHP